MPPHLAAAFTVLTTLLATAHAWADGDRTSSLSWVELPGAESCGGAPAVTRAVEQRLGRRAIVSPSMASTSIEVRVEHTAGTTRWVASVALRDTQGADLGEREFSSQSGDCAELRAAAALGIALMIDPDAMSRPEPTEAAAAGGTSGEQAASGPETRRGPDAEPPGASSFRPNVAFALGFGVMPSLAAGIRFGFAVEPSSFSWPIEASAALWFAQDESAGAGASARFSVAATRTKPCSVPRRGLRAE